MIHVEELKQKHTLLANLKKRMEYVDKQGVWKLGGIITMEEFRAIEMGQILIQDLINDLQKEE